MVMKGIKRAKAKFWIGIPPWIIVGAVIILVPIFVFWTLENIHKQKEHTIRLLVEKGAALIRSFEAGARTGMMGMMGVHGGRFQLQRLLAETAQQPDIVYLTVVDVEGIIVAHSNPAQIGQRYAGDLDLEQIARSQNLKWRQVENPNGADIFEVFRQFSPSHPPFRRQPGGMMHDRSPRPLVGGMRPAPLEKKLIFVGFDMGPIEAARREDIRHTVLMGLILLLVGFAGIVSLFLAQAYRSARTSLTRIKAFSDTVVENIPMGLVALDASGRVASFNHTAEAVLQLSSAEVLGREAGEILPQGLWSVIDGRESKKGAIEREIDCTLRDGSVIPLEVGVASLEEDDGAFLGDVILFRDLTEVQNLKREVERSQRLASLGRLAAGIAHEIRNPLSSIKGFATYFKERYKEIPEDQKTAEIMVQEVERLNRVIGQLLEFARPMTIQRKRTSLQTLIQHSLKMIEGEAHAKGINVTTKLSPEIGEISIDPDRMSQVLLNLYLNSIEAMEHEGSLSVELSWDDTRQRAKITVSDTGIGINKEDLVHIFDPYFTTKQSGTGLGLAIVHAIIESHKGEVKVESETGKGSTVTIFLPISAGGEKTPKSSGQTKGATS